MNYSLSDDGVYEPSTRVVHRDDEYPPAGFYTLLEMQKSHFWYRGRHRFLYHSLKKFLPSNETSLSAVDLGGGVGGWINYLIEKNFLRPDTLALADSSREALRLTGDILPKEVSRYQIDLMNLGWNQRWDIAFMLDVIEHLPEDDSALIQVREALKPNGLLFITAPAFRQFWSYNDEISGHKRRYVKKDLLRLAEVSGLELVDSRYFMFFLSPLYWLARNRRSLANMDEEAKRKDAEAMHRTPPSLFNSFLSAIFSSEARIGHCLDFPFGTSILGVFRRRK